MSGTGSEGSDFANSVASVAPTESCPDPLSSHSSASFTDLAGLITDRVAQYRVPIEYTIQDGNGSVKVGHPSKDGLAIDTQMEPFRGPDGEPTRLLNSAWSTIPGNEALLGKASHNTIDVGEHGMAWAYEGRNSIQGLDFRLHHDGDAPQDEGDAAGLGAE